MQVNLHIAGGDPDADGKDDVDFREAISRISSAELGRVFGNGLAAVKDLVEGDLARDEFLYQFENALQKAGVRWR